MYIESNIVELKECFNEKLAKEIEAFLNTQGGTIYLGVKDDGSVIGIKKLDETLRKVSDVISDQIHPSAIDCVTPEVIHDNGLPVVKVNVLKGSGSLYCVKKYGFSPNGCHVRVGTTCKSMTLEMIKDRFLKDINCLDLMIKTPSYLKEMSFTKLRLLFEENGYHLSNNSFKNNLKLLTLEGRYNFLAELLADKNNFSLTFAKFKGINKATYSERLDYGNQCLLLAYEKMKGRLELENVCKTITTSRPRQDIYLFDIDAVNEALINAIIHNDYRVATPLVSFFDDRLEIMSYGGLPEGLTKDDFYRGISNPRNAQLADIFKRLGIVEQTGHGVPTIIQRYGKKAFEIKDTYINVIIPFNKQVLDSIGGISGGINGGISGGINGVINGVINETEHRIIDVVIKNQNMTAKDLSIRLKIPLRSTERYLANLKKRGIITRSGSNKSGYWEVVKRF